MGQIWKRGPIPYPLLIASKSKQSSLFQDLNRDLKNYGTLTFIWISAWDTHQLFANGVTHTSPSLVMVEGSATSMQSGGLTTPPTYTNMYIFATNGCVKYLWHCAWAIRVTILVRGGPYSRGEARGASVDEVLDVRGAAEQLQCAHCRALSIDARWDHSDVLAHDCAICTTHANAWPSRNLCCILCRTIVSLIPRHSFIIGARE